MNEPASVSQPGVNRSVPVDPAGINAVTWSDGRLDILDQRRLPRDVRRVVCEDVDAVIQCVNDVVVHDGSVLAVLAAYGAVLAARDRIRVGGPGWREGFRADLDRLRRVRPTEVSLGRAIDRMLAVEAATGDTVEPRLLAEARQIHWEDIAANQAMASFGASLIEEAGSVVTGSDGGALTAGGLGSSMGVIREGFRQRKVTRVWISETRSRQHEARLAAWELAHNGIPARVVADAAVASLMRREAPAWLIVSATHVAANGDVVNPVGTYALAVLARHHGVRVMVVAPSWCCDAPPHALGGPVAQEQVDVTPAELVSALVTEKGLAVPPSQAALRRVLSN